MKQITFPLDPQNVAEVVAERDATIESLRASIEDAVETLEAMDLHVENPLYDRLRAAVETV